MVTLLSCRLVAIPLLGYNFLILVFIPPWTVLLQLAPWIFFCDRINLSTGFLRLVLRRFALCRFGKVLYSDLSLCASKSSSSWMLFGRYSFDTNAGLFGRLFFAFFDIDLTPLLVLWPDATASARAPISTCGRSVMDFEGRVSSLSVSSAFSACSMDFDDCTYFGRFDFGLSFVAHFALAYTFSCYYCSGDLTRQSKHSGLRPDTSSLNSL